MTNAETARKCERCGQESDGWRYCLTCAQVTYRSWQERQS